jgi:Gpi18-like mannosyltransferase/sugar lactone lactonase YvrE
VDLVRRLAAWSSTPVGLASLFAVGLLIRLVLAGGGGFPFDISSFTGWANRLVERGPWHFYPGPGDRFFVDYPPGYLYVLWIIGRFTRAIGGGPSVFWLKLPSILADLGLAWVAAKLASRLAPASVTRRLDIRGPAAAAILLNPAVFFISSVWGQVDVFLALLVVGALLMIATGPATFRREAAGVALLAVAVGTKPQGAFALPMVVLFLAWRHVRSRLEDAGGSWTIARGVGRLAALGAVGVLSGLALLAPFRMGPAAAYDFYARASSTYKVTSVFAFNGWGFVGFWRPDSGSDAFRIFGIPALVFGLLAFSVGGALILYRAWRSLRSGEDEGRVLVFGCASITLLGFAVLTRVHERYLFLPLALIAVLVGRRWMRRAFVVLSGLYLINVFFPYVYYLKYVGRPAPTLGGLFETFYGSGSSGIQLRALSAVTAVACLFIATRGWRAVEAPVEAEVPEPEPPKPPTAQRPDRWQLRLHPVGRPGAVIALIAVGVALLMRLPGLAHPPGMYFDEVYHARTGAEYIGHKEVFEWTHPPLAKLLISYSMEALSGFGSRGGGDLPRDVRPRGIASDSQGFYWVAGSGGHAQVSLGRLDSSCALKRTKTLPPVTMTPTRASTDEGNVFVAGSSRAGEVLSRFDQRGEMWRAPLPGPAKDVVALGDRAFVLTTDGSLVFVSAEGSAKKIADGAGAVTAEPRGEAKREQTSATQERVAEALPHTPSRQGIVWASLPARGEVVAWDADGQRSIVFRVPGKPSVLTAPDDTERLFVSTGNGVTVLDSQKGDVAYRLDGDADALISVPETELAWALDGRALRAIEPRSGVVIGRAPLARVPDSLVADPVGHRVVAVSAVGLECASGRPQLAWRLGSAVMGSLMVAMVALLALRLFGNIWLAGLAAFFLAVDGLAFTMSRIAIPESYTTAFLLASWFCLLSALYRWGAAAPKRSRLAAFGWLIGTGLLAGAAGASKWVALYGFAGMCLFIVWDGLRNGRDGLWGIAGTPGASMFVLALCLGALPVLVYVATYIPYLSLGHSFGELFNLQGQMYAYHAHLQATHPFSSPWYGWPFGYRAVFLYLAGSGFERSEIWTIPNLVVFWGGLLAMGAAVARARATRSTALAILVFAALVQFLPWVAVGRVVFLYHYLSVVPFLAIALAWILVVDLRGSRYRKPTIAAIVAGAAVFFVAVLPMLEGWQVPVKYLDDVRAALFWVIP